MSEYTRMMIVEAISDEQAREVRNRMDAHVADRRVGEDGYRGSERLSEDGGGMIVFETHWESREAAIRYHSSRGYRQLVAGIQHLLLGDPVVKLFQRYPYTETQEGKQELTSLDVSMIYDGVELLDVTEDHEGPESAHTRRARLLELFRIEGSRYIQYFLHR